MSVLWCYFRYVLVIQRNVSIDVLQSECQLLDAISESFSIKQKLIKKTTFSPLPKSLLAFIFYFLIFFQHEKFLNSNITFMLNM